MNHWKKALALSLALVLCLGLLAGCNSSPAATPTPGGEGEGGLTTAVEGELHMATNAAFPPYEMVADGEGFGGTGYEGIDVEIAHAIAEKLGLKLVVDNMDFSSVITSVQLGKSDMAMAGLTVRPDRLENVNFTDSYATGVQVVIVKEGSPIASLEDLLDESATYIAGTQEATTGYIYMSDSYENGGIGEDRVIAYNNGAIAVQALISGSVDCVVIDNEPAKAYVAANDGLVILDTEYVTEDYAIGIAKEHDDLLEAVNNALGELIADGTVQSVIDKYISAE